MLGIIPDGLLGVSFGCGIRMEEKQNIHIICLICSFRRNMSEPVYDSVLGFRSLNDSIFAQNCFVLFR